MKFDYRTENIGNWVIRYRKPKHEGFFPAYLLLHGWTGDENSMWVFESKIPDDAYLIFYPRLIQYQKLLKSTIFLNVIFLI